MTVDQGLVFTIISATMALFIWGRWRYDVVAVTALLACVFTGVVPSHRAFVGFGHPAVITVASVLIISRALQESGLVDRLANLLARARHSPMLQIGATSGLTALMSAFMNNIGALALMLPVALRSCKTTRFGASNVLMPLSFASLLGGLVTMIGTPPNIIIATFRADTQGTPFGMFDFTPVGLPIALIGILFLAVVGWRLIPRYQSSDASRQDYFPIATYVAQVTVPPESDLVGSQVRDIEQLCEQEAIVMAVIRGRRRMLAPMAMEGLEAGDILILEGDTDALKPLLEYPGRVKVGTDEMDPGTLQSSQVQVVEAVVMPGSQLEGGSMRALRMREQHGANLLAMAREGKPPMTRLGSIRFKVGDVLLLQGERASLSEILASMGCLALKTRGLTLRRTTRNWFPILVFTVAIIISALRILPVEIAFVSAVVVLLVCNILSLRDAYRSIKWPIIVLLGALIPVGESLQHTGATAHIADVIVSVAGEFPVAVMLGLVILISMVLSDLIHNSPTAILMAPIAVAIAGKIGLPADPFLMAVAVGSASPYLTPIGHQSNTLVMGPGGYRFGDYWRMGLPLDVIIITIAVPMIMWVWVP